MKLDLNITATKDPETGRVTGWINDFPAIVTEADNEEDLRNNLWTLFNAYTRHLNDVFNNVVYKQPIDYQPWPYGTIR